MRTIIATTAVIVSLLMTSISSFANGENLYKTETMDEATKTLTVTTCKGNDGANLTFYKKHTIQYNEAGSPAEKVLYTWTGFEWEATQKYSFEYDSAGQISKTILKYWDKSRKEWSDKKTS